MARTPSRADIELAESVSERIRAPFSVRQLVRWREAGFIDPPARRALGRGAGTTTNYRPEQINEVAALARAGNTRRPRDEAVLAAFASGDKALSERAVRRAYLTFLRRGSDYLRSLAESVDPAEIPAEAGRVLTARAVRSPDGRRWRRRLRGRAQPPQRELEHAMAELVSLLLWGRSLSAEHFASFLAASGLAAAETDRLPGLGPLTDNLDPGALVELMERFSLPALSALVESVSFSDLCHARDQMAEIVALLVEVGGVLGRVSSSGSGFGLAEAAHLQGDLTVALMAPAIFVFTELDLPVDPVLELARRFLRLYRAAHKVIRFLPKSYARYFAPDGAEVLAERSAYVQTTVRKRLLSAMDAHPQEAAILRAKVPTGTLRPSKGPSQRESTRVNGVL